MVVILKSNIALSGNTSSEISRSTYIGLSQACPNYLLHLYMKESLAPRNLRISELGTEMALCLSASLESR